jgi:hypothetical protein
VRSTDNAGCCCCCRCFIPVVMDRREWEGVINRLRSGSVEGNVVVRGLTRCVDAMNRASGLSVICKTC